MTKGFILKFIKQCSVNYEFLAVINLNNEHLTFVIRTLEYNNLFGKIQIISKITGKSETDNEWWLTTQLWIENEQGVMNLKDIIYEPLQFSKTSTQQRMMIDDTKMQKQVMEILKNNEHLVK